MNGILKVLLIEADDIAAIILKKSFQHAGFHLDLLIAANWQIALSYLSTSNLPDLIFLEPVLPDITVQEALQWMQEQDIFNRTNVYLLSAILPEILKNICDGFPHIGCLAKPVKQKDIQKIIATIQRK